MEKTILKLSGLGCASCAAKIEDRSKKLSGVNNLTLDFARSKLTFEHEGKNKEILITEIKNIVRSLEPDVIVSPEDIQHNKSTQTLKTHHDYRALLRLGISLLLFFLGLLFKNTGTLHLVFLLLAYLLSGHKVLLKSFRNIIKGDIFDENFLMSIATFGAIGIGEYPEAVAVMIFYEIGEYFQDLAVNKSKSAISSLLDIRPDSATVNRNGLWVTVNPEDVQKEEIVLIKPGERIPLDGVVIEGSSSIDISALTGESIPDFAENGTAVLSGSVVLNGIIQVKVSSVYGESTVSRILELVENATAHKSPTENFITKFARYYTPTVVAIATALILIPTLLFGTQVFSEWLYRGLIFLVISCPCALVVSVPLGFFSGIGNASQNGILVKGGNYLEALNQIDTVVFDKTGTLTEGRFEVYKIHLSENRISSNPLATVDESKAHLLKLAALAESNSNHPIAKSIVTYSKLTVNHKDILHLEEISGQGVVVDSIYGKIIAGNEKLMSTYGIRYATHDSPHTQVYIALDQVFAGSFEIRDKIKTDSKATISTLKSMGYRVLMLTGDKKSVAEEVATLLGIEEVYSELLPSDKYNLIQKQKESGSKIAFVGDGINDAPVLALSDVGISMGAIGSDAAIEASDIVLMTDEPSKIPHAIKIARKTKQIVTQNIVFALGTKLFIMILGAIGIGTMWMAIFADVGVALIAVLNATRILGYKAQI